MCIDFDSLGDLVDTTFNGSAQIATKVTLRTISIGLGITLQPSRF